MDVKLISYIVHRLSKERLLNHGEYNWIYD